MPDRSAIPSPRPRKAHEVDGYCPMGCGRTLFRDSDARITCHHVACPDPAAVATILGDRETDHVVQLTPTAFTVRHPLRERLGDALMACDVHDHVANLSTVARVPGRYRVAGPGPLWTWERLDG